MNLFGWFGSGTEETKEDDNDNVTINNNNEFDLLDMPNSFFQQESEPIYQLEAKVKSDGSQQMIMVILSL